MFACVVLPLWVYCARPAANATSMRAYWMCICCKSRKSMYLRVRVYAPVCVCTYSYNCIYTFISVSSFLAKGKKCTGVRVCVCVFKKSNHLCPLMLLLLLAPSIGGAGQPAASKCQSSSAQQRQRRRRQQQQPRQSCRSCCCCCCSSIFICFGRSFCILEIPLASVQLESSSR